MAYGRLKPTETEAYKKRKNISEIAGSKRLAPFYDLDLIENFAERFGLDPDYVYTEKDFDTVITFAHKWHIENEVAERRQEIERMMSEGAAKA